MAMDGKARVCKVTPVVSSGAAYASGDQVGGVLTLTAAMDTTSDTGAILSIVVIDKDKQNSALDILFFNSLPTVASTDNAALDVSDDEMSAKFIGRVSVEAADYTNLANCSDATVLGVGLLLHNLFQNIATTDLYAVIQCLGSPTYTSTSGLVLKVGILQD